MSPRDEMAESKVRASQTSHNVAKGITKAAVSRDGL